MADGVTDDEQGSPAPAVRQHKQELALAALPAADYQPPTPRSKRRRQLAQPSALSNTVVPSTSTAVSAEPTFELLRLPEEVLSVVCSHLTPKRLVTVCAVGASAIHVPTALDQLLL